MNNECQELDQFEYIKFDIINEENFQDFLKIYEHISQAKLDYYSGSTTYSNYTHNFWLDVFPKYVIEKYDFNKENIKPQFETFPSEDNNWPFYRIIEFLIEEFDAFLLECTQTSIKKGKLQFEPNGYPYGGTNALIILLKSFDFLPNEVDEGADIYNIRWVSNMEYKLDLDKKKTKDQLKRLTEFNKLHKPTSNTIQKPFKNTLIIFSGILILMCILSGVMFYAFSQFSLV